MEPIVSVLFLEATSLPQLREEASGHSLAGPLPGQRRRLEVAGRAEQGAQDRQELCK